MSLFVLDTDMLTLLEEAHPVVAERVRACPPEELAVTVVTVEEKLICNRRNSASEKWTCSSRQ